VGLVGRGLHLNGHDLGTTGKEKVNLVVVFPTLGGPAVVKEFVPGGGEHLGNNVLVYVTQVGGQFVAQEVLMITLYIAMDSFGTACNVTGDGAIALIVDRLARK